jgi:diacylglycerol kinase (ATP)
MISHPESLAPPSDPSKICVLFNPKAGSAALVSALRDTLAGAHFIETKDADELARAAAAAARGGCGLLVIAGGDGTIHAVVNALGPDFPATPLAVIPLGTGNDLCRTLGVPLDPTAAAGLLAAGERRGIDVLRVEGAPGRFVVNAATGGFSGRVAADITHDLKGFWGPLAYLRGALGTLADPPRYRLTLRFDGSPPQIIDALNVVVANGRTAGGGLTIAPRADPEDGLLDVVIVRSGDRLDLSIVAAKLMEGDYLDEEHVVYRRAKRVDIESDPPLPMSLDGELAEGPRFAFEVVPRAVRFVVGPEYAPAPPPPPAVAGDDEPDDPQPRTPGQRLFGVVSAVLRLGGRLTWVYALGLWVAVLAVGGFAWLATGVMAHQWDELNAAAYRVFHHDSAADTPWSNFVYASAVTFTRVGDSLGMILVGGAVALWYVTRRRYLDAMTVVAVAGGSWVLTVILKAAFGVARPDVAGRLDDVGWYSFPSSHAVRGVALYVGLAALFVMRHPRSRWRWAVAAGLCWLAGGICWSRLYLGVHWLTDVVGGALAAVCWVTGCLLARHYARQRLAGRGKEPASIMRTTSAR